MAFRNYQEYSDVPNDYITKSTHDYDNERELYSVLATEAFLNFGTPITYYFTSFNTSADPVYGEDAKHIFTSAVEMQMMFEFPNRSRVYDQFGITSVETFNMYVTMDHFDATTGGNGYKPYIGQKPKIGDVVRSNYRDPFGYTFYEISNVNQTTNQFIQGQYFWTLTCKLYNDSRIFADESLKDDPIYTNTNQSHDIFDLNDHVDLRKSDKLYIKPGTESNKNVKLLGDW